MEVFTDFEEGQKPWNKERFVVKCHDAYNKMPLSDKSELIKLYNPKVLEKQKEQQKTRNSSTNKNKVYQSFNIISPKLILTRLRCV